MIPASTAPRQGEDWQRALARAVTDADTLLAQLGLPVDDDPARRAAAARFPLRVPQGYVSRMRRGDPDDPLLRQVLPLGWEERGAPGYVADPVGDLAMMPAPGVLQKYDGRALVITTGACAIHCRYCFRREFPYAEAQAGREDWAPTLEHLAADPTLSEVILSGGDPLVLSDRRLSTLLAGLAAIPQLRRVRLHTRLPVVLPERVDARLPALLTASRLTPVMVVHANHPQEIDDSVVNALRRLAAAGVRLFNQAVLLKGINDDADTLINLSEVMFNAGVTPYYLHQLDRVRGAAHFEVDDATALALIDELRRRLPGYLVPRLVREIAGQPNKTPLSEH